MEWLQRISPVLRHVGQIGAPVDWIEPARVIYDHQLVVFSDSSFVVSIDSINYRCDHGSYLIIPPGRKHITQNIGNRRGSRAWVHFCWDYTEHDYLKSPLMTYLPGRPMYDSVISAPDYMPKRIFYGTVNSLGQVLDLHRQLGFRWNFGDSHDRLLSRSLALEILTTILDTQNPVTFPESDHYAILAYKAHRIVETEAIKDAGNTENLAVLLGALDYSYEHISRVFQRIYGISPQQYLTQTRLTQAKRLLQHSNLRVRQIAFRVGYQSASYFCRLFRTNTGMSPGTYRENTQH